MRLLYCVQKFEASPRDPKSVVHPDTILKQSRREAKNKSWLMRISYLLRACGIPSPAGNPPASTPLLHKIHVAEGHADHNGWVST